MTKRIIADWKWYQNQGKDYVPILIPKPLKDIASSFKEIFGYDFDIDKNDNVVVFGERSIYAPDTDFIIAAMEQGYTLQKEK